MIFRQLFDADTGTYTYLLADPTSREAVLIDPVRERVERDVAVIQDLGLKLLFTLETHVHADHVTGASLLKDRFGSQIVYPAASGVSGADRLVAHGDSIRFGQQALEVRATPGHTDGCVSFVTADRKRAFTGDALLIRGSGRTDFQQGDARRLFRSVHDQLLSLPDDTEIFPGHDYQGRTMSTVAEERGLNPRLGGSRTEDDFVAIMGRLQLAHPKRIDVAVPANLRLGRLADDASQPVVPQGPWAPVTRTPTGAPQVAPEWLVAHRDDVRVIDVRELEEWRSESGHIDVAELAPLGTLADRLSSWERSSPIVLVCRSSGRSDRAAVMMEAAGFRRVASMVGGMLKWNAMRLPVQHEGTFTV